MLQLFEIRNTEETSPKFKYTTRGQESIPVHAIGDGVPL